MATCHAPPDRRVARRERLLPALREEQVRRGCISPKAMLRIAEELGLSPAVVYGVATFYHELLVGSEPEVVVRVCDSPSCHLAGSESLIAILERLLQESQPGVRARLERVGCLGQCDRSPAMVVGGRLYQEVRPRDLPLILKSALSGSGGEPSEEVSVGHEQPDV